MVRGIRTKLATHQAAKCPYTCAQKILRFWPAATLEHHEGRGKACARALCHGDRNKHAHGHRERQEPENRDNQKTETDGPALYTGSDGTVDDDGHGTPQKVAIAAVKDQEWVEVQHTIYSLGGDTHRLECAAATKRLGLEQARPL